MMNYCVDLEIAKELKKNGFPQKSFFMYDKNILSSMSFLSTPIEYIISAPTSDELLEKLPNTIEDKEEFYYLNIFRETYTPNGKEYYLVSYQDYLNKSLNSPNNICFEDDKLSNALACLWIQLKKQGYIK